MKWFINQRKTIAQISLLFLISQISLPLLAESVHDQTNRAPRHDYANEPEDVFGGQPYITYIPKDIHITGDLTVDQDAHVVGNLTVDGSLITSGGSGPFVLKAGDIMTGNLTMTNQNSIALGEASVNGTQTINLQAPSSVPSSYTLAFPPSQGDKYGAPINDGSGSLSWQNPRVMVSEVDFDMNGFVNRTDSTFSFDDASHTFTIQPTGASYTIFYGGVETIKTGPDSFIIDDSQSGTHFIFFNPTTHNLTEYLSFPGFDIGTYVATVYWSAPDGKGYFLGDERHSSRRDTTWHLWAHTTIGTKYENGLDINGYTPNTATDAAIQIGITPGTIADEDIVITITNGPITTFFQQPINYPAAIPVVYKSGLGGIWKKDTATLFPYRNDGLGGSLQFNEPISSIWQPVNTTDGNYIAYWIIATDNVIEPIISMMGQRQDITLNDARTNNTIQSLDRTGFPFQESRVLYRIILQTDTAFGGTMHAKISDVVDMRSIDSTSLLTTFLPPAHSNLVGNELLNSHPASAIMVLQPIGGILNTATDVQMALATIGSDIDQPLTTTSSPTFAGLTATGAILADGGVDVTGPFGTLNLGTANTSLVHIGDSTGSNLTTDIYIGSGSTTVHIPGTTIAPIIQNPQVIGQFIDLNVTAVPQSIISTDDSGMRIFDGINPSGAQIVTTSGSTGWQLNIPSSISTADMILNPGAAGFTIQGGAIPLLINQSSHDPLTIGTANGLSLPAAPSQVLSLQAASAGTTGALTLADWNTFNNKQDSSPTLDALALLSSTGFIVETSTIGPTFGSRNLVGTPNQVIITNGNGILANPTFSLPQDIALTSTPTFASMTLNATINQLILRGTGLTNTITITAPSASGARIYTLPDTLIDSSFVMSEGNQTINGDKTISGTTNLSGLTPSLPLQLDASNNIISQAITLTSGISGILPIANGGTNSNAVLNNNRIMVSNSGSIVEASALTNGQLLIGSTGTAPIAANISGTANQVTVTNGAGTIILSLPSAIVLTGASSINSSSSTLAIGDSVTTTLTLGRSGQTTSLPATISIPNLTASLPLQLNASNNVISAAINLASQITGTLPPANGGTGSTATLANGQLLIGNGTATPSASTITGTANQVTVTNGAGTITLSIPSAVILTGASSINSSSSTLAIGDSVTTTLTLGRTGQTASVPSNLSISGPTTTTNSITLNATNELRFADTDSSNYVGFKSPGVVAANTVWTLPNADGTLNQALVTNGAGTLSWATLPQPETYDYPLIPPFTVATTNVNLAAATTFVGAVYTLNRDVIFSKIVFRLNAYTAPGTISMYFYQTPNGTASKPGTNATKITGITSATPAAGVNSIAIDGGGTATLKAGIVYVLWGRSSAAGAITMRSFNTNASDLFNTNMLANTYPTTYTTAIAANTTPLTFDAASQSTATTTDTAAAIRLVNF